MKKEILFFNREAFLKHTGKESFKAVGRGTFALYSGIIPEGRSFVSNITDLYNSKATLFEKGQYLYLVSMRNHLDVILRNDYTLHLELVPHVPVKQITNNRLLLIKHGKIYFYHEEN